MPRLRTKYSGFVSAGSREAKTAARLGVNGRLAHQTWSLFIGGAFPVSLSRIVSDPT